MHVVGWVCLLTFYKAGMLCQLCLREGSLFVRCVWEVGQNAGHTSDKNILISHMCLGSAQDIE